MRTYIPTMIAFSSALVLTFILSTSLTLAAFTSPGQPAGYVNDFAGIFSPDQKQTLENELSAFDKETTTQISVATVASLNGEEIETYANELFREWGIGSEKNNGVLLLIAPNERKVRIEVGYGLEGALTDLQSNRIINEVIIPQFKAGDYAAGTTQGAEAIMKSVKGEDFGSTPVRSSSGLVGWFGRHIETVFILGFIIIQWLAAILGRSKSWWLGGLLGGIVGIVISLAYGILFIGLISILVLIPLGLLFDFIVSAGYSRSKVRGAVVPWFFGGSGGFGSGGSSGGFGGFGGGSSGGGGGSGSW